MGKRDQNKSIKTNNPVHPIRTFNTVIDTTCLWWNFHAKYVGEKTKASAEAIARRPPTRIRPDETAPAIIDESAEHARLKMKDPITNPPTIPTCFHQVARLGPGIGSGIVE